MRRLTRALPWLLLSAALAVLLAWHAGWPALGYYLLATRLSGPEASRTALDLANYRAEIEARPVAGIPENASGLTFHPERRTLFTVINKPAQIAELTTSGELLRTIPLHGALDVEGITHQEGDFFIVTDEGRHQMIRVEIGPGTEEIDIARLPRLGLAIDAKRNVGYEGVSWDSVNRRLFVVKEKNPLRILEMRGLWEVAATGGYDISIDEWLPVSPARLMLRDLSSLTYHEETGHLFLLSDESKMLVEYDAAGNAVALLALRAGWHGLKKSVPQAEGVAFGNDRAIYVLSEPNLLYRFAPAR